MGVERVASSRGKGGKAVGIFFLTGEQFKEILSIFWCIIIIIINITSFTLETGVQRLSLIQVVKIFSQ